MGSGNDQSFDFEKEGHEASESYDILYKYRYIILTFLLGLMLMAIGVYFWKTSTLSSPSGIEVLESVEGAEDDSLEIVVEISGAVENPGVYKLTEGDRVEDLLVASGGLSQNADTGWVDRVINRAARLADGQKLYIPSRDEQTSPESAKNSEGVNRVTEGSVTQSGGLININTASQSELEELWGIGPVYAQNIIEQRPYSNVDELLTKHVIRKDVFERNKDKLSVY